MLADMKVRQAKATGKPYTSADFDGLSLFVSASGSKTWHFRYTWVGQRSRISLGSYPELSLRDEARSPVAKGINPCTDRKQKRQAIRLAGVYTFMAVYEKWMQHRQLTLEEGRQSSLEQIPRVFKKDVFPLLKRLTIYEITRPYLLEVIGRIEKRNSLSVAEKVGTWLKQLFDFSNVASINEGNHLIKRLSPLPMVAVPELKPDISEIQRKHQEMLAVYEAPHNLAVTQFAKLAGKSRDQVNRELKAGKLLALKMGNRGQRIPDWQLDPVKSKLARVVLGQVEFADAWQIYNALTQPHQQLDGHTPIDHVTLDNVHAVAEIVSSHDV
jgi:hypothetical protein